MTAIAGEIDKRLGHEGSAHAMLFRKCLDHELEKTQLIGCFQRVAEVPVDFKLAIGIFMIVLIGPPTKFGHGSTNFSNDIDAPHDGRLVIARFILSIARIRNCCGIRIEQVEFRLHTCHQFHI